jgi:hypothetical protein
VNANLRQLIDPLFPDACQWAEAGLQLIRQTGRPLSEEENALAGSVGVGRPDLVRILTVPSIPIPEHSSLREACRITGLLSADTRGLTLFHGIYLKESAAGDTRLLAHELRHVAQYESHRTLAAYLTVYFDQIIKFGYEGAPYEIDATVAALRACA